jgi:hypothetical protein
VNASGVQASTPRTGISSMGDPKRGSQGSSQLSSSNGRPHCHDSLQPTFVHAASHSARCGHADIDTTHGTHSTTATKCVVGQSIPENSSKSWQGHPGSEASRSRNECWEKQHKQESRLHLQGVILTFRSEMLNLLDDLPAAVCLCLSMCCFINISCYCFCSITAEFVCR